MVTEGYIAMGNRKTRPIVTAAQDQAIIAPEVTRNLFSKREEMGFEDCAESDRRA